MAIIIPSLNFDNISSHIGKKVKLNPLTTKLTKI